MTDYKKITQLIKDAKNLNSLICILGSNIDKFSAEEEKKLVELLVDKARDLQDPNISPAIEKSIRSERLAAMGHMAAAISHELRNPLSGIKVASEYLMRKVKNQPELIDIVVNIHNEVIFANNIISNILEHARINKPNFEKTSIKKLVDEAVLTISQQGLFNNISIEKKIAEDLPVLELDPGQIRQVISNLLINSAEAMVGGGELKIEVFAAKKVVIVSISDTGPGIEKTHIEKVFEPFFSTKVKGIGLGLAITKEIVENHNGEIIVNSKLGKGANFTLVFPIAHGQELPS